LVLKKQDAEACGITYDKDFISKWLHLDIHSSLQAVGLTAAFATELGKHGISANVVAAYYHDHIFVDKKDGEKALKVL